MKFRNVSGRQLDRGLHTHEATMIASRLLAAALVLLWTTTDAECMRLDAALVSRGLCTNRAQAKNAIQSGHVTVGGKVIKKATFTITDDDDGTETAIAIAGDQAQQRYVSRAGDKLHAAIEAFGISADGAHILDVGASTGGFTDCLLKAGAASATCVDCGHGQLHDSLKADPRVTSLEGVNARDLTAGQLPRAIYDLVVVDVSFISLQKVLPSLWPLLQSEAPTARLVALVKPQFEAGREAVAKGKGLIKDAAVQLDALQSVVEFARVDLEGCACVGSIASPILGGEGQKEFLIALAHSAHGAALDPRGPFVGADAAAATDGGEAAEASDAGPSEPVPSTAAAFEDFLDATPAARTAEKAANAVAAEAAARASEISDGLVPIRMSRPSTAASRSSKYAKQKEVDSLRSGRDRAGKTDGAQRMADLGAVKDPSASRRKQSKGARGRKTKEHRQAL